MLAGRLRGHVMDQLWLNQGVNGVLESGSVLLTLR